MAKSLVYFLMAVAAFVVIGCSSAPKAPAQKNLSAQPHNRPESWEGTGGLGAAMGTQFSN